MITTSRVKHVQQATLDWIEKHYKNLFAEIHFAGFYDGLKQDATKHTKAELLQSIGADYLVDDHPKHCIAAAKAGITSLMFGDYSWNREFKDLPDNLIRVRDWHAIKDYFSHELAK